MVYGFFEKLILDAKWEFDATQGAKVYLLVNERLVTKSKTILLRVYHYINTIVVTV